MWWVPSNPNPTSIGFAVFLLRVSVCPRPSWPDTPLYTPRVPLALSWCSLSGPTAFRSLFHQPFFYWQCQREPLCRSAYTALGNSFLPTSINSLFWPDPPRCGYRAAREYNSSPTSWSICRIFSTAWSLSGWTHWYLKRPILSAGRYHRSFASVPILVRWTARAPCLA